MERMNLAFGSDVCSSRFAQTAALIAYFFETAHLIHDTLTQRSSFLEYGQKLQLVATVIARAQRTASSEATRESRRLLSLLLRVLSSFA
jgi:hypothetical protein